MKRALNKGYSSQYNLSCLQVMAIVMMVSLVEVDTNYLVSMYVISHIVTAP
jgi:hypothetical protein